MYQKQSKKSLSAALLATAALSTTNAFTVSQHHSSRVSCNTKPSMKTPLFLANNDVQDEVAKLRAAAAKLREDAQRSAKEMGKEIDFDDNKPSKTAATKSQPKASREEIVEASKSLTFKPDNAVFQASALDKLVEDGKFSMWKSAKTGTANTNSPTPLRPFPVSLSFLESRTNGKITGESLGTAQIEISMDDFKDATIIVVVGSSVLAIASLALLPENIGATFCYLFAIIPVIFIGIGSSAPGIIAGGIGLTKGSRDDAGTKIDRICRHEAAHFLCGYVCGLPVIDYSVSDDGFPCVEFYPTNENNSDNANDNIATREFSPEEIATLSVVSMSGSVGEVLTYDTAKGGENDLLALNNQYFRRSQEFLGAQKQQDLTRWGALSAYNILQGNYKVYEKLIDAFKNKKSVNECIQIIESGV